MELIPQYTFNKSKYGDELLVDVVTLPYVKEALIKNPVHKLTYYEITLITGGTGFFCIDTGEYNVTEGDVMFSLPGVIRHWDKEKITNGFALIFGDEFLLSFFNDPDFIKKLPYFQPGSVPKLSLEGAMYERILKRVEDIKYEIDANQVMDKHILRALLYETLMLLYRAYKTENILLDNNIKIKNPYADKFVALVNADFKCFHSTVYYADKLCITPNYMNEIIKEIFGVSAKQYIQSRIVLEAKKMLTYTDMQVVEIACDLGFNELSYFIRFFRGQTGSTPLKYKKANSSSNL